MLRYANYLSIKLLIIIIFFKKECNSHRRNFPWLWGYKVAPEMEGAVDSQKDAIHHPASPSWASTLCLKPGIPHGLAGGAGFPWPIKLLIQKYQDICHQSDSLGWWSRNVPGHWHSASVSNMLCSWESPSPPWGLEFSLINWGWLDSRTTKCPLSSMILKRHLETCHKCKGKRNRSFDQGLQIK